MERFVGLALICRMVRAPRHLFDPAAASLESPSPLAHIRNAAEALVT
jgi:hypothetical protein